VATIRYTTGYDLLHRITTIGASLTLAWLPFSLVAPPAERMMKAVGSPDWLITTLGVVFFLALYVAALLLLARTVLTPTLPSFLYLRLSLGVPATWREAAHLRFLFFPDDNGHWYPLREVRKLPRSQRLVRIRDFADQLRSRSAA